MTIGAETNAIYQDLIDQALALEIDLLRNGVPLEDARLARTFGCEAAIVLELRRLQRLNADARHFDLGAYHNALLHAIVSDFIESLADRPDKLTFCNERYVVGRIDLGAFMETFFLDEDFTWPADLVNHLTKRGKHIIGIDDDVFGVANELAPAAEELRVTEAQNRTAVRPIFEMTEAIEADLRRLARDDVDGVKRHVAQLGVLYRAGATFPFDLDWLEP